MNHKPLRLLAVCAALSVPALASVPAHAQPVDAASLVRQRQLFDQGNKLYDAGRLPEAEAAYLQAWRIKKSFDVAGNLGNLEADLKKWRQAAELLSFAIAEFPAGGKPAMRENLLKRQAEVARYVGQLRVTVNHPGAEVWLDGTSVGVAPLQTAVFAEPGGHVVEARLDGFPPVRAGVNVTQGRAEDVSLILMAKGANRTVVIAGGVVAGVAAIAGAAFTGLWAAKGSSAKGLNANVPKNMPCPADGLGATGNCAAIVSDLKSQATFGSAAIGTFSVAGAVGIATVIYAVVARPHPARTGLLLLPSVSTQGGGLSLGGTF